METTTDTASSTAPQQATIIPATNGSEVLSSELVKYNLEPETKSRLLEIFSPFLIKAEEWRTRAFALVITDPTQLTEMQQAREGRLVLKSMRTETERLRKTIKEDSLQKGRAIDAVANLIKGVIEPIEDHLDKQENYTKIKEAERKAKLKVDRVNVLTPLGVTIEFYNLEDMTEEAFKALVEQSQNQIIAKQEAERKAVEEQAARANAEREELERQKLEAERLRQEAAALEARRQAEAEEARKREEDLERKLQLQRDAEAKLLREAEEKRKADLAELEAKHKAEAEEKRKATEEEAKKLAEARELIRLQEEEQRKAKIAADLQAKRAKELEDRAKAAEEETKRLEKLEEARVFILEREEARKREEERIEAQVKSSANVGEQTPSPLTPPATTTTTTDLFADIPTVSLGSAGGSDKEVLRKYIVELNRVITLEAPISSRLQSEEARKLLNDARGYFRDTLVYLSENVNKLSDHE